MKMSTALVVVAVIAAVTILIMTGHAHDIADGFGAVCLVAIIIFGLLMLG